MKNGSFFKSPPAQQQKQDTDWLVKDLIRSGRLVLPAAYPGEGKSLINAVLLYSIAYNAPFADIFEVTPGNVMFIDSENPWEVLKERRDKIVKGLEMDGYRKVGEIDFQYYSGFLLDNDSNWQPILNEVDNLKPVIISLDHLANFHNQDENLEKPMKKVVAGIRQLMSRQGSSVYVNHHFNKSDIQGSFLKRLRGTSALLADAETAFEVRAVSRKKIGDFLRLEKVGLIFQARKDITPLSILLSIEEGKDWLKLHYEGEYHPIDDPLLDRLCHELYHYIFLDTNDTLTTKDVFDHMQKYAAEHHAREALMHLRDKRELLTSDRKGLGGAFSWKLNNPSGRGLS